VPAGKGQLVKISRFVRYGATRMSLWLRLRRLHEVASEDCLLQKLGKKSAAHRCRRLIAYIETREPL
jgi:hypothetical protein